MFKWSECRVPHAATFEKNDSKTVTMKGNLRTGHRGNKEIVSCGTFLQQNDASVLAKSQNVASAEREILRYSSPSSLQDVEVSLRKK